MKKADRAAFAEIVIGFAELKGRTLSAPAIELYWRAMQSWSIEEFRAAAATLLTRSEWMPTPKDFQDLRKAGRDTAGEAWARARAACGTCRSGAHYGSGGTCGDEFIDRVVRAIGGYRAIALCETDKLHFLERRFAEHYETQRDAEDIREALPQIANRRPALALPDTNPGRESSAPRRLGGPAR